MNPQQPVNILDSLPFVLFICRWANRDSRGQTEMQKKSLYYKNSWAWMSSNVCCCYCCCYTNTIQIIYERQKIVQLEAVLVDGELFVLLFLFFFFFFLLFHQMQNDIHASENRFSARRTHTHRDEKFSEYSFAFSWLQAGMIMDEPYVCQSGWSAI